jgi:hypothetical protein
MGEFLAVVEEDNNALYKEVSIEERRVTRAIIR